MNTKYSAIATSLAALAATSATLAAAQQQPSFSVNNPPDTWQPGQTGTNQCTQKFGASSANSNCQTAYINSADDFCLFTPPSTATIGESERYEISYCTKSGYGTRLIPDGTITSSHFVKTPYFVQVVGTGDLTRIGVAAGDAGGELDPHGADGNGNPIGGLVYSNAMGGGYRQSMEWMQFISSNQFCFRACLAGSGEYQAQLCQHIYDVMGCNWVMPTNAYNEQGFDDCQGDAGDPPGIYNNFKSTFYQGQPSTPAAHPPPATSNCQAQPSPSNGLTSNPPSGGMADNHNGNNSSSSSSSSSSSTLSTSTSVFVSTSTVTASSISLAAFTPPSLSTNTVIVAPAASSTRASSSPNAADRSTVSSGATAFAAAVLAAAALGAAAVLPF
ncbi:hypothetical protein K437DRAFT_281084 [Tilletiaria anomala UBC 951]|uniref:Carbohydrate-binding module family 13 protein n=1 Tax=Tilletiaria anomala (strain ATCC 24038 / CBS 436.72 / UBC 951) TaxID=1037660 RepID=A0A066WI75_TILAU|nr:uncharacterized protein K437DRAFT_281084 [Tilletiaria anomala UBC 951]KDN52233.1 hypothetical protein K437DRAFT_281084 [Tilletiaria anomala UBC 951]